MTQDANTGKPSKQSLSPRSPFGSKGTPSQLGRHCPAVGLLNHDPATQLTVNSVESGVYPGRQLISQLAPEETLVPQESGISCPSWRDKALTGQGLLFNVQIAFGVFIHTPFWHWAWVDPLDTKNPSSHWTLQNDPLPGKFGVQLPARIFDPRGNSDAQFCWQDPDVVQTPALQVAAGAPENPALQTGEQVDPGARFLPHEVVLAFEITGGLAQFGMQLPVGEVKEPKLH
jgi:hypothetical protein